MATATLKLKFGTMSGEKTWSFKYAKEDLDSATVKSLVNAMIANGSIYVNPPLTAKSATMEIVSTTVYNISD